MIQMYEVTVTHAGLGKFRIIRGRDRTEVVAKASEQEKTWNELWARRQEADRKKSERERAALSKLQKNELAVQLTSEAEETIAELENLLNFALDHTCPDIWEGMFDRRPFGKPRPKPPVKIDDPEKPDRNLVPPRPHQSDAEFQPMPTLFDKIIPGRTQKCIDEARHRFESALAHWKDVARKFNEDLEACEESIKRNTTNHRNAILKHKQDLERWQAELASFEEAKKEQHHSVAALKAAYESNEPSAVTEYFGAILSRSVYPDYFPQNFETDYAKENRSLILDYFFPKVEDLPSVKSLRYNQSQDKIIKSYLSESARNRLFEESTYRIALRTLFELFSTDQANALESVVFNGFVESIDKATGRKISPCILSVQVSKDEFQTIDLEHVDPKACFRKLKGVSAARLHTLTPIAPVAQINREDKRFVESYGVAADLDDSVNLAAMDWEDFEHLIRELFEKEFSGAGGEVKVTQASRDGGVDAVAFDPDPIRGGKIVIQAKRYTNVVGVAAVRDLFGTVMNEGANKGILVTTSYYGSDAYEFAKGKPLTLLDGGNLLSLLGKHGHKAKIDLQEAKKTLSGRPDQR